MNFTELIKGFYKRVKLFVKTVYFTEICDIIEMQNDAQNKCYFFVLAARLSQHRWIFRKILLERKGRNKMRIGNFCNFYPKSKIFLNKVKILKIFFSKKYKFGHFFLQFFCPQGKKYFFFGRIFTYASQVHVCIRVDLFLSSTFYTC